MTVSSIKQHSERENTEAALPVIPAKNPAQIPAPSSPQDYRRFKTWNKRVASLKIFLEDCSLQSMPQWVNFATTFVCNLSCPHCETHGTVETRKVYNDRKLNMPFETLAKVARESMPWASEFSLSVSGEPLATPELPRVLRELNQYGAKLDLITNGTYFSRDMLIKLLPVTSQIHISIDGATQLTCEAIRLGVKFNRLLKNVRLLTRTLELLPDPMRPSVSFAYTIMGSNIRDLPEMVRLAKTLHVPLVSCSFVVVNEFHHLRYELVEFHKPVYNYYYQQATDVAQHLGIGLTLPDPFPGVEPDARGPLGGDGMIIKSFPEGYYETLPPLESWLDCAAIETEAVEVARHLVGPPTPLAGGQGKALNPSNPRASNGDYSRRLLIWCKKVMKEMMRKDGRKIKHCEFVHKRMYVGEGGDVTPCCITGRPVLGNVYKNTVREIWNGELYNEFRRRFYSSDPVECCKNCVHVQYLPH